MLENRFLRNKDLIDQKLLDKITVIGLGGIGSSVVTLLSIMGFNEIIGYDDDTLEEHNLSSTTYPHSSLGAPKVDAALKQAQDYSGGETYFRAKNERWDASKGLTNKVITCLDNMDTRMEVYEEWRSNKSAENKFLIDLRMSALSLEMITISNRAVNGSFEVDGQEIYEKHWVPDHDIPDEPCTMKHTIFSSSVIAGLGVSQVFNCVGNKPYYSYIWSGLLPLNLKKSNLVKPYNHGE